MYHKKIIRIIQVSKLDPQDVRSVSVLHSAGPQFVSSSTPTFYGKGNTRVQCVKHEQLNIRNVTRLLFVILIVLSSVISWTYNSVSLRN